MIFYFLTHNGSLQAHQDVFKQLVDLIGITSIMEVLVRLVGSDDHLYPNSLDVMQWLADSNLLEMIVDKLNTMNPPEVHANAAESLCAITRNAPSPWPLNYPVRGELLMLLNVSSDEKILPTTYGELRPPLGKHRLKIVEFLSVLLKTGNEVAEKELVGSGTIHRVLDLLFEYPYNNALHHHVESIIYSCLESKNNSIVDHLLLDCNLIGKILLADKCPALSGELNLPTLPASGRHAPRAGYLGHLTRISNKLVQLGNNDNLVRTHLQENSEWKEWQTTVLQERNMIENVHRWACGRPTALQDRTKDSDEEDVHDRDYDVAALANNLSQAFRYSIYDNDDAEVNVNSWVMALLVVMMRDVYFDDESAEVVISSLRLGDDQGSSLFTNSNWFAFQDDMVGGSAPMDTSAPDPLDDLKLNGTSNGGNSSSDDEVVVEEDEELTANRTSTNGSSSSEANPFNGFNTNDSINGIDSNAQNEKTAASNDSGFFRFETTDNDDPFGDRPIPEWVAWGEATEFQVGGSSVNPFDDQSNSTDNRVHSVEASSVPISISSSADSIPNGTSSSPIPVTEDVEFVGVELEGTEKAMEQALKEGIVGEAGPLKRNIIPKKPEKEDSDDGGAGMKEFNDANYWRVDQEVAVSE
ncbi:UNVERIFIED_CONTAM: Serine/threonine-protein phosphatase 6 regulatory subunit [Sesamum radiatum]|uniref:Serine/threonine-protein phosphatase 6 regulatory subunit n=1 Tax=Sesamum radiatum TaxID=300843 RepID=A0AAW2UL58_SESRA